MAKLLIISMERDCPPDAGVKLWGQTAELLAANHQVACSVQSSTKLPSRIHDLEKRGIKVTPRRSSESKLMRVANWFLPHALKWQSADPILNAVRTFRPHLALILQEGNSDGLVPMEVCQRLNVPYANLIQAVPESVHWPHDTDIQRQRPLYHGSKRLFFVAERNRKFLETQFATRFPNHGLVRSPLNLEIGEFPAWPALETPLRLACVARLDLAAKGQDLLLDVMSLPKWRERAVTIDFFGTGPNQWIIEEQIRRMELAKVKVRGAVENDFLIWAAYHALVLPSRLEGLPSALVEAFRCGRPAVVTRVGGNSELVDDGVNGFVAPAPTIELMDQALERLWENRTRLADLGACARQTVARVVPSNSAEIFARDLSALLPGG